MKCGHRAPYKCEPIFKRSILQRNVTEGSIFFPKNQKYGYKTLGLSVEFNALSNKLIIKYTMYCEKARNTVFVGASIFFTCKEI